MEASEAIVAGDHPDSDKVRPFRWEEREFDAPAIGEQAVMPSSKGGARGTAARAAQEAAEAQAEAAADLAAARAEADAIREQARQQGMQLGREEGAAEVAAVADRLSGLLAELGEYKATLYSEARDQVLELTLALVRKLLGPLAAGSPEAVVQVVERSLTLLSDREQLTIRVHPDDLKVLMEAKPKLLEGVDGIQKLTVLEDPSVRPGGCLVQTPTTEIDARLDTQLQELARGLRNP